MISQTQRLSYWEALSETNIHVAHNADIMDGAEVVGQRKSFCADIGDELVASEILKLHFPCVVANLVDGIVIKRDDQQRFRYLNKLSFLNRFSVDSNADPSIPKSKEAAFDITYTVMMEYLKKLLDDYEDNGGCGYFRYIDETSIRWEAVDLTGSNMCGWDLVFTDEEPLRFNLNGNEPPPGWQNPPEEEQDPDTSKANKKEIIHFTNEIEVQVPWTDARVEKFGEFPMLQVWKYINGKPHLVTVLITADDEPVNNTFLTVHTPGTPGFIVIM